MTGSEKRRVKTVGLYISSKRGLLTLKQLLAALKTDQISYVVSARDANVEEDYFKEIAALCSDSGVRFFEKKLTGDIKADFCLAVGWRSLIPKSESIPLIVVHDSLLPRYRGFNPVVTALIEGDEVLGATAFIANERYDEGDIIAQRSLSIQYPLKIGAAIDLLAELIGLLCCDVVCSMFDSEIEARPQDHHAATYSLWRDELDYKIDWHKDSVWIKRFIDAVGYPFKGASSLVNGSKTRILESEVEPDLFIHDRRGNVGKLLFLRDDQPVVVCGSGLLRITNMVDETNRNSILPLKKFRVRFE